MTSKKITLTALRKALRQVAEKERVPVLMRFFKTGKGEYGYGDVFLGVTVPNSRKVAKQFAALSFPDLETLLHSKFHEERLVALLILVKKFARADESTKKQIYQFYLAETKWINNWDLVDLSAEYIIGEYLLSHPAENGGILAELAVSPNLWERRIAVLSTFAFIKAGRAEETMRIAEMLLSDKHDLIHKAVGWMLREVGKRVSKEEEKKFLDAHAHRMPRTMLRYAIEHFPESVRRKYLSMKAARASN